MHYALLHFIKQLRLYNVCKNVTTCIEKGVKSISSLKLKSGNEELRRGNGRVGKRDEINVKYD